MPRYTVDLSEEFDRNIERLAKENNLTKSEVIRRALATYNYLKSQTGPGHDDLKVSLSSADGTVKKEVILP